MPSPTPPDRPPASPTPADLGATLRQLLWETGLTAWILLLGLAVLVYLGDRNPWFSISDLPTQALGIGLGLGGLICMGLSRIGASRSGGDQPD